LALLLGTSVATLFAAIATAGEVRFAERAPSWPGGLSADSTNKPRNPTRPERVVVDTSEPARLQLPHIPDVLLSGIFVASISVVAGLLLLYAWRRRPRLRIGRRRQAAQFEVLDDVAAIIGAQADAQRTALLGGSPRNAIVECWLLLEHAVVAAGVGRNPADTSTELTVRVLTKLQVDEGAIEHLAALYREARFSDHAMGEDARSAAVDALDDIHDGLRAADDAVVATT